MAVAAGRRGLSTGPGGSPIHLNKVSLKLAAAQTRRLKPPPDCLVASSARYPDGLGVIADDNPRAMPRAATLTQHTAKKNRGRTGVRIYAA